MSLLRETTTVSLTAAGGILVICAGAMAQDLSEMSAKDFPFSYDRSMVLEDEAYTSANVSLGDVNGDGYTDIVLVKGRHWPLQNVVRLGDGEGGFGEAKAIGPGPDRSYTGLLVDLDFDGDLDMLVSNDTPDPKRVLHNDGEGNFTEAKQFGAPEWRTRHVAVLDANSDGYLDVVAANRGGRDRIESFICLGRAGGVFEDQCEAVSLGSATTITPADMDGDGDTDLVIPHRDGGQSQVLLNDGQGGFTNGVAFGPADAAYRSSAVGDFDNDGYMDIAVIAPGVRVPNPQEGDNAFVSMHRGIFFGTAAGDYEPLRHLGNSMDRPYAIKVADINSDGRKDIIIGHVEANPVLWVNIGERRFIPVTFGDDAGAAYGFDVADLNGDGLNDIAMARSAAQNIVYFARRRNSGE